MTAALEDASDWKPWSMLLLRPPDSAFWTPAAASLVGIWTFLVDYGWVVSPVVALAFLLLLYWYTSTLRRRFEVERQFISYFAELLQDYMGAAIANPEGFEAYRRRRQGGGGTLGPGSPLPA
jgi:hypothetical protein